MVSGAMLQEILQTQIAVIFKSSGLIFIYPVMSSGIMGAPKAWYLLTDGETGWDQVPLDDVDTVASLKEAIKKKNKNKLKDYDSIKLGFKAFKISKGFETAD